MAKEYDFLVADDSDHEFVFVEIYYKQKFIALINQEKGIDNLEIEFPGSKYSDAFVERKIPLIEFLDLVTQAAKLLKN